jgi:hypothetical protein
MVIKYYFSIGLLNISESKLKKANFNLTHFLAVEFVPRQA